MIQSKQIRGMAASSVCNLLRDHEELCAAYAQVYDEVSTYKAQVDVILCTAEMFGFPRNQSVPRLVKWLYTTLDANRKELAARDVSLADATMENMRLRASLHMKATAITE